MCSETGKEVSAKTGTQSKKKNDFPVAQGFF